MEKYEKVLALMKSKGGKINVDDPELIALLGDAKKSGKPLIYRIAVYMSYIRRFAKLEVKANRNKRIAVSYELIDVTSPLSTSPPGVRDYQQSKYIKEEERRDPHSAMPVDIYARKGSA